MKKLLVVVDYQKDFVNGALGFPGAENLLPGISKAVEDTIAQDGYVLFTRDTHEENYLDTREGRHLPISHCIKGTSGHSLFGDLRFYEKNIMPKVAFLDKPTFGSADITGSAQQLCGGAPDIIEVCGVVTDICVLSNALILHTGFPLAKLIILADLCGSGNKENEQKALDLLKGMGLEIKSAI